MTTSAQARFLILTVSSSLAIPMYYDKIDYQNLALGEFKPIKEIAEGSFLDHQTSNDLENVQILKAFAEKMLSNSQSLPVEIQKLINDEIYDML